MRNVATPDDPPGDRQPTYVFVPRVRCPFCSSARLASYRSTNCSDGSTMRHTICNDCHQRFRVVVEDD